jgi:hypothetical protein
MLEKLNIDKLYPSFIPENKQGLEILVLTFNILVLLDNKEIG